MNRTTSVRRWPRGLRLSVYTAAVIVTIVLMIACAIGSVILAGCEDPASKSPVTCFDNSRILITAVVLAVLVAVGIPWVLFLARFLGIREESVSTSETSAGELPASWSVKDVGLPFGQHLVSGEVESVGMNVGGYRAAVQGLSLRFWGGDALRNGSIKTGDRAIFVYQMTPLFGLKYVLVFWKGGNSRVRSVGGIIHACYLALGIGGASVMPALQEGHPAWSMPIFGVLSVESSVYLLLLFFTKKALHNFIERGVSN